MVAILLGLLSWPCLTNAAYAAETAALPVPPASLLAGATDSTEAPPENIPELRPNPGPEPLPPEPNWRAGISLALLSLVIALGMVVAWYGWWRRTTPRVPPRQRALAELDRLRDQALSSRTEIQHAYGLISDILRQYLHARFQLPALHQTTSELLQSLDQANHLTPEQKTWLAEFLRQADLVKFARSCPSADEVQASLAAARQFIQETSGEQEA